MLESFFVKMKKLSIIIVSYNVKHYLEQCLASIRRAAKDIDVEVYVVDNHSHDGSVKYLEKRFPEVNFVASNHNFGFARANNIGIRDSEGEYVLLLNPDTIVGESVLSQCIEFMDSHPDAGACGVRMLKTNGENARESRRGVPNPMTAFYKMSGLCSRFPNHPKFGHYYMSGMPWDKPGKIEIVSGAFCFIRRKALDKVGLLDEDFFMYGEDIDLSYRILKGNFTNWYLPCKILHYKGESTQKGSFGYVHVFYDAMLIFFRKHYDSASIFLTIPIKTAIYFKAFFAFIGLVVRKVRKSLGFFTPSSRDFPEFLFLGSSKALDDCRRIARQKGLVGRFVECGHATNAQGHLKFAGEFDSKKIYQIVYDTSSYSYEQILDIFASHPLENVFIGTYDADTSTIITQNEIYKYE